MEQNPNAIARRAVAVRPLLARLLGRDPGPLVHQPYGYGNLVFRLPAHGLVAKTSPDLAAFAHTAANLRVLRSLGLPVPNVVAAGDDGVHAVLVLEWIPGRDLGFALAGMTTTEKRSVAGRVAEIQRRVDTLPRGRGYGWTPIGGVGSFPTWTAVVEREIARLPEPIRALLRPGPAHRSHFRGVEPLPFLDDLTVKNVLIHEGRLSGIVDLDFVCYGDPLFGLALAEATAVLDCDDADYGRLLRAAWAPTRFHGRIADLYAAIFAAGFLARSPSERMRLFFERRLDRASRTP